MIQLKVETKKPWSGWLFNYRRDWLRPDMVAGLTTASVIIPQAMAYATIAGLPVEVGLYTALTPMLVYALLGSSRALSVGAVSAISMLTATALAGLAPEQYRVAASTLALLVGLFLLLARLLRLGFMANFISAPVLTGFKAGIGLVIIAGQLGKIVGLPVAKGPFFQTIGSVLQNLGELHWPTVLVALVTIALLVALPRLVPRLPAPLVAVAAGVLASALLQLQAQGVALVGVIPPGLPDLAWPDLALVEPLYLAALSIALLAFTESTAAARTFARPDDPPINADRELLALGAANLAGSFFQAYPAAGGASQTAVNDRSGAKSQAAALVTVSVVVVTLLFLGPLISLMPQASLGALVLVVASTGLIKPAEFRAIGQIRRMELAWALVALVGVVGLGTLHGILVAVAISLLTLLYHANHPPVYALGRKPGEAVFRPLGQHPGDETFPGLLLARTEGRLHFANGARVGEKLLPLIEQARPQVLVLDCSAIPDIEYTALKQLTAFEANLRRQGMTLWLAALNPEPLRVIERSPFGATLGHERMFLTLEEAVAAYQARANK